MQVVEVSLEDGSTTLCMIPSKFNKKVWIRVGGILIIDRPVPLDGDAKITSNVISVLSPKDLKILSKSGIVPFGMQQHNQGKTVQAADSDASDDIPPNPNHRNAVQYEITDSESD